MPELSEIAYSRDATVAAFRDYYRFLTKMYLEESDVIEPPEDGWPTITPAILEGMEKDDEVIELLRHLPYIRSGSDGDSPDVAPWAKMMDWQHVCRILAAGKHRTSAEVYKFLSEGEYQDAVPSAVVGLTDTGPDVECFLLDTEQGTIYWPECDGKIKHWPTVPMIDDDPYDYCENDKEAEWRNEAGWAISDFFETLKDQFRELHFIPISTEKVIANYGQDRPGEEDMRPMLQEIYREHGWPNLNQYRKEECLKAVQKALVEHYPDRADYRELNEEEAKDLDARIKAAHEKRYPEYAEAATDA